MASHALSTKYAVDRVVGTAAAVALLPVGLMAALALIIEATLLRQRWRPLFGEHRVSQERPFLLYKFRVVRPDVLERALRTAPMCSLRLAERETGNLTRVGRVIRKLRLDHLPGLINVAKGDICLVGPRPFSVGEWNARPERQIGARRRLKAGLVGPYQAAHGPAVGGHVAEEAETGYLHFVESAWAGAILANDLRILARGLATAIRLRRT